jgi:zinc protease
MKSKYALSLSSALFIVFLSTNLSARTIAFTEIHLPDNPLVSFRIMVHSGAINDPAGKEGLNALTAMTIAYGGTGDLAYRDIQQTLYPWAASIHVHFDKEVTVFLGNVHRDHLYQFYEIFSGLILNPRFDDSDLTRNRTNLLNYLKNTLRGTNDEELGKWAMQLFMYDSHPYGHVDAGTVEGLESISIDDIKAFHRTAYVQDNVRIGIAGGYDAALIDRIERDFSSLPPGKPASVALPVPKPIENLEVFIVEKPNRSTAISLGFPIEVTRADKDFFPLMVANSYFGEHRTFNGVLMNELRGLRGLNYGTYSYSEHFVQDGGSTLMLPNVPRRQQYFGIWIRPVEHINRHFALRLALYELDKLITEGLTEEEFTATRDYLINFSKLWTQTLSRRLGYAMDSEWYGTSYFIDKIEEELNNLTVHEVNAAIRKHLQAGNIKIAVVTDNAAGFKEALLGNSPSPITYANPNVDESILAKDKIVSEYALQVHPDRFHMVPVGQMFEKK